MALPNPDSSYTTPIPNNPFYYPETDFVYGNGGWLVVGSGLDVDAQGVLTSTGGGGGGAVSSVAAGAGISVNSTTGNVVVTNTGVLNLTAGAGVSITGTKANLTITSLATGTVTAITAGTGLTGGIITTSGVINVDGGVVMLRSLFTAKGQLLVSTAAGTPTVVGSGGFPNGYVLTVDNTAATGVKWAPTPTSITSITGSLPIQVTAGIAPVISVDTATTSNSGVTTLVNDLTTNDPTKALTAAQGYALNQQLSALLTSGGLILAGTLDATTGNLLTVTNSGTGAGFTAGSPLPLPAAGNNNYFVIATVGGNYAPPGGAPSVIVTQGDWFLSDGTVWNFLDVGPITPLATTTVVGGVRLATLAEVQAGTDSLKVLTPQTAFCTYIQRSTLSAKGALITATSASNPVALPVGTDGQVLTACAACPEGLTWVAGGAGSSIPLACITGKGAIVVGTAISSPVGLTVGTDGQVLTACSACTAGVAWVTSSSNAIPCACINAKGALITGTGPGAPTALAVGTDGQLLKANAFCANGIEWADSTDIPCSAITSKGVVLTGSSANTPVALAPSANNGDLLAVCAACPEGLTWVPPVPEATPSDIGTMQGCTSGKNTVALGQQAGVFALSPICSADCSVLIGKNALAGLANTCNDVFIGFGAGCSYLGTFSSQENIGIGSEALATMSGSPRGNIAIGTRAGYAGLPTAFTGCFNVGIGHNIVLPFSGNCNLRIGPQGSTYWLCGSSDLSIQPGGALRDTTGAVGSAGQVLFSTGTGIRWCVPTDATPSTAGVITGCVLGTNTVLGTNAYSTPISGGSPGNENVVAGFSAGLFQRVTCSVVIGGCALNNATALAGPHERNVAIGTYANSTLTRVTCDNVAVGFRAGCRDSGCQNVWIGSCAGGDAGYGGSNNTSIGFGANPGSSLVSNTVTLGNANVTTLRAAVTSITAISDERDKENIRALPLGLDFVKDLNPVQFRWRFREQGINKDGTEEAGFIAQELAEVQTKHEADFLGLVNFSNPDRLEASPGKLLPIVIKALQELTLAHEELKAEFDALKESLS